MSYDTAMTIILILYCNVVTTDVAIRAVLVQRRVVSLAMFDELIVLHCLINLALLSMFDVCNSHLKMAVSRDLCPTAAN